MVSSLFFKKQRIFSFQQGAAWFRLHFCASRTTDLTFPRGFVETSCRSPNVSRKRLDFFHNSCYNKIVLLSAFVCPEMGKWQQKSTHSNRICFDFPIFRASFPCRCSRTSKNTAQTACSRADAPKIFHNVPAPAAARRQEKEITML